MPEAALVAARAADAKLGQNTVVLAMGEFLGVTDAFVITSGANTRQVRTIVDEVEHQVKESAGRAPRAIEGLRDLTGSSWTTATSWSTSSRTRPAPTTTSNACGATCPASWSSPTGGACRS